MRRRRQFLRDAVQWGCLGLSGCNQLAQTLASLDLGDPEAGVTTNTSTDAASSDLADAGTPRSRGGSAVETLGFENEGEQPFGELTGAGWDGRLYTDLTQIADGELLIPNDLFYIRTRYPDLLDGSVPWSLALDGLVDEPLRFGLDELVARSRDQGAHLLECAGNHRSGSFGLMSAATWNGVPLAEMLPEVTPSDSARAVLVTGFDEHSQPSVGGHSTPGASWILTFDQIEATGAFLATHMNGEVLPLDHGYPLRLVVPGWYGCTCIKWVQSLTWVDEDAPATSQMIEFASRTHQDGVPALARDFNAPSIQQAAMPIRIEKWRDELGVFYRIVGVLWGGQRPAPRLQLSFDGGVRFENVDLNPPVGQNQTWTLWHHIWEPPRTGEYVLQCRVPDPDIPTVRLDSAYYQRSTIVDEV